MSGLCRLSVIVTFYNQKDCVDRALQSIFAQEFSGSFEVLIGDDGSTDGSWERICLWKADYPDIVKPYQWDRSDGFDKSIFRVSRSRVKLAEKAQGDYLVFLDGDDVFCSKNKFKDQVDILERYPEYRACMHNFKYVMPDGTEKINQPLFHESRAMEFDSFWKASYLHVSCFMFRTRQFNLVKSKLDSCNFDDNSIVFSLASGGKLYYLDEAMFAYCQSDESSWNSMSTEMRLTVNLKDYYYESGFNGAASISSSMRHRAELAWFRAMTPHELKACENLFREERLFDYSNFCEDYQKFLSGSTASAFFRKIGEVGKRCIYKIKAVRK